MYNLLYRIVTQIVGFMITKQELKEALPPTVHKSINDQVVDDINKVLTDPDFREAFRDNMISYNRVLSEGKFKLSSYLEAVMYVSYKVMGHTNMDAYAKVFPDKVQGWLKLGKSPKDISAHVAGYNNNKLVNLVYEQAVIPTHILNQDKFQAAINKQFWLMNNAASEKVQSDAANSLLTHLKQPENKQINLNIGMQETDYIRDLKEQVFALAATQKQSVELGLSNAKEVAASRIIAKEVIEHDE